MEVTPMLAEDYEVYENLCFRLVFLTIFRHSLDLFNGAISSVKVIFDMRKIGYHYSDHMRTLYRNIMGQINKLDRM
jgi:hypothetical protein